MRLCVWQFGCVSLLLATVLSQAWAKGPEPRLVADEFQEKLEQVPTGTSAKPQEALDFPLPRRQGPGLKGAVSGGAPSDSFSSAIPR